MERRETMQRESWLMDVDDKLRGVNFPLDRNTAEEKLRGVSIEGEDASNYFDRIDWPVNSRDEFVDRIRSARGRRGAESAPGEPGLQ
jgi:predicted transcriptional regulator